LNRPPTQYNRKQNKTKKKKKKKNQGKRPTKQLLFLVFLFETPNGMFCAATNAQIAISDVVYEEDLIVQRKPAATVNK
jgi:hypothetical protein